LLKNTWLNLDVKVDQISQRIEKLRRALETQVSSKIPSVVSPSWVTERDSLQAESMISTE